MKNNKIYLILFLPILLMLTSCSNKTKNCNLVGTWKSVEFYSDKAVDNNDDGVYNKELSKEDKCVEVIMRFMSNGQVVRLYKNKRTHCKIKKSKLQYVVKGNQIVFTVSGMKQKQQFDIVDCKLKLYGIVDYGLTKKGKQKVIVNAIFEKE